jgi:hypothetical protein
MPGVSLVPVPGRPGSGPPGPPGAPCSSASSIRLLRGVLAQPEQVRQRRDVLVSGRCQVGDSGHRPALSCPQTRPATTNDHELENDFAEAMGGVRRRAAGALSCVAPGHRACGLRALLTFPVGLECGARALTAT